MGWSDANADYVWLIAQLPPFRAEFPRLASLLDYRECRVGPAAGSRAGPSINWWACAVAGPTLRITLFYKLASSFRNSACLTAQNQPRHFSSILNCFCQEHVVTIPCLIDAMWRSTDDIPQVRST